MLVCQLVAPTIEGSPHSLEIVAAQVDEDLNMVEGLQPLKYLLEDSADLVEKFAQ